MTVYIKKFGSVLMSRYTGKEDYTAFLPTLAGLGDKENIFVYFDDVSAFSPSWGDEFLTPLQKRFGNRLTLKQTQNPSVSLTITTLEKSNGFQFKIV